MKHLKKFRALASAATIGLAAAAAPSAQAALIGYYTFENSVADVSGNGNHGTMGPAAPTYTASGHQGGAYQFGAGGLNTYLTVPININPSALPKVTFGAWFNADGADAVIRGLISHDNGGFDRTLTVDTRNADGAVNWQMFTGGGTAHFPGGAGNVAPDDWTFVAVVYDMLANTSCLYVDGTYGCVGASPSTDALSVTTIGRNPNFDFPFIGRIDDVFFFDEALSKADLDDIRRNGIPVPTPATLPLVLVAAAGLVVSRRRVKATGAATLAGAAPPPPITCRRAPCLPRP
jgi:hypothetical protein